MRTFIRTLMVAAAAGSLSAAVNAQQQLMIPDWSTGAVNSFDPYDGSFIGPMFWVPIEDGELQTLPLNAIDVGYAILVSDISQRRVFRVLGEPGCGMLIDVLLDAGDGLDLPRGMDLIDSDLLVVNDWYHNSPDEIARFAPGPVRGANFTTETLAADVLVAHDSSGDPVGALVSDWATNAVRVYDVNGNYMHDATSIAQPNQVQFDVLNPGHYLVVGAANQIQEFDIEGNLIQATDAAGLGQLNGVYRLRNGNFLVTSGDGVFEVEPGTGAIVEQEYEGQSMYIEPRTFTDCNNNGEPDACDLMFGVLHDDNGDGIADECQCCPGDLNCDGSIDITDLAILLSRFGERAGNIGYWWAADINHDGEIGIVDLAWILARYGTSPPC